MLRIVADFHIHSLYAQATSKNANLEAYAESAKIKGVNLLGTGDITNYKWLNECKEKLKIHENGIYEYKNVFFILTGEINNVFEVDKKVRKIHHLIMFPSFEMVEQANDIFKNYGNLEIDGRPTLNLDAKELIEILESISKKILIIPAHAWTPWYSIFGSKNEVSDMKEIYGEKTSAIKAIETGLSSDPPMNWMVSKLDNITLISNSDAHSADKVGREANLFFVEKLNYESVYRAITERVGFIKTYEFFPEEGKYHFDGHRKCNVCLDPWSAKKYNNICPVCKKPLTLGVLHRVLDLSDRNFGFKPKNSIPYQHIVPLKLLISKSLGLSEQSKEVEEEYMRIINYFGNELSVFEASEEKIKLAAGDIGSLIIKVKREEVKWRAGYDGVYGELILKENGVENINTRKQLRINDFLGE